MYVSVYVYNDVLYHAYVYMLNEVYHAYVYKYIYIDTITLDDRIKL